MGLFGVAEVLDVARERIDDPKDIIRVRLKELLPNPVEIRRSVGPTFRGDS